MTVKDKKAKKSWKERLKEKQIKHQKALEAHRKRMEMDAARKPRKISKGKILMALCLVALVLGFFVAWQSTQPSNQSNPSNPSQGEPTQPTILNFIYILADGKIKPETASILRVKDTQYRFTADVSLPIIVERDNIVIDGAGYTLQGSNVYGSRGIDLTDRNNVTVKNLTIKGFDYGIYLASASNIILSKNNLTENYCGIWLTYSSNNIISANTITKNDGYGIWIKNSESNKIYENTITLHANYTIYIGSSKDNIINDNLLTNNSLSIFLYLSDNNTISHNNIMANGNIGIYLYSSYNNAISQNNITANREGIQLSSSSKNLIIKNHLAHNDIGLDLSDSSSNVIYHNNFIDNVDHVFILNSTNTWDDGKEGNYWSNYKEKYPDAEEIDGSGIWDTAYVIDENNRDRYPKVNPNF